MVSWLTDGHRTELGMTVEGRVTQIEGISLVVPVCLSTLLSYFSVGNGVLINSDTLWDHNYEATTSNHCGEAPPGTQRPAIFDLRCPAHHWCACQRGRGKSETGRDAPSSCPVSPGLCWQGSTPKTKVDSWTLRIPPWFQNVLELNWETSLEAKMWFLLLLLLLFCCCLFSGKK